MPLLGISIKLWNSDFDQSSNEFLTTDSVVYVFQDRSQEDILYISSVVKQLTGDCSLDDIFSQNLPSVVKENYNQNHIDTKEAHTPEQIAEKRRLAHMKR